VYVQHYMRGQQGLIPLSVLLLCGECERLTNCPTSKKEIRR
jgi:hypothetical protein